MHDWTYMRAYYLSSNKKKLEWEQKVNKKFVEDKLFIQDKNERKNRMRFFNIFICMDKLEHSAQYI